jgi:hypothetical protein
MDWPQAAANPQHTAFQSAETLAGTTWSVAWRVQFSNAAEFGTGVEKLHNAVQPIISGGRVLITSIVPGASPTGRLRGYPAGLSKGTPWTVDVGAFSMGSCAADGTTVYVADVLGRITAYTIATGAKLWGPIQVTDGRPFHASLLIADSKLLIGGTDGVFYARSPSTGAALWRYPASGSISPILQTAAWSNTTGTGIVVFGSMNGRMYGLNSATGALIWQTAVLTNAGLFRDYWPVIIGTGSAARVLVRPIPSYPHWASGVPAALASPTRGITVADGDFLNATKQAAILSAYASSPSSYIRSLWVLDLADGDDDPTHQLMHHYWPVAITGATSPPCVDATGRLILGCERPTLGWTGQTAGYGRVDPTTRAFVDLLSPGTVLQGGNRDENIALSACSNGVLMMHTMETNAFITAFWRQTDNSMRTFGGGAAGTRLQNNNQGGASPGAISGGLVYHVAHPHTLVVWRSV